MSAQSEIKQALANAINVYYTKSNRPIPFHGKYYTPETLFNHLKGHSFLRASFPPAYRVFVDMDANSFFREIGIRLHEKPLQEYFSQGNTSHPEEEELEEKAKETIEASKEDKTTKEHSIIEKEERDKKQEETLEHDFHQESPSLTEAPKHSTIDLNKSQTPLNQTLVPSPLSNPATPSEINNTPPTTPPPINSFRSRLLSWRKPNLQPQQKIVKENFIARIKQKVTTISQIAKLRKIELPYPLIKGTKDLTSWGIRSAIRKPWLPAAAVGALGGAVVGITTSNPSPMLPLMGAAGGIGLLQGAKLLESGGSGIGETLNTISHSLDNNGSRASNGGYSNIGGNQPNSSRGNKDSGLGGGLLKHSFATKKKLIIWGIVIIIALILLIAVLFSGAGGDKDGAAGNGAGADKIEIKKRGPNQVDKKGEITYQLTVTYKGVGSAEVTITDTIPKDTEFKDTDSKSTGAIPCQTQISGSRSGNQVKWNLSLSANIPQILCLTVTAPDADTYVYNIAEAEVGKETGNTSNGVAVILSSNKTSVPDTNTDIAYTAEVKYTAPGSVVLTLSDPLPSDTKLISKSTQATDNPTCDSSVSEEQSRIAPTWEGIELKSGESKKVCITLRATKDQIKLTNIARAKITEQKGAEITGGDEAPNDDTCNGKYTSTLPKNPTKKNFGDPFCSANRDDMYAQLKAQDPENADFWFFKIIKCESSYNPNEYLRCLPNGTCTPDPAGAWGLFQMGSDYPGNKRNGDLDRGDVPWQKQISNAVNFYRRDLLPKGRTLSAYWACAR